jgi:hypothetical protein
LKKLDFLDRDQLQRLHRLGKVRNANRVLGELSPYLQSFREGYSTVYYLSALGREAVDSKKVRRKNQFVNHVLMRNEFYLFSGCPSDWRNEIKVTDGKDQLITDSLFKAEGRFNFVEIDSTQKMSVNKEKANKYRAMYERGAISQHFGYFPTINWVTTSEVRRKKLQELFKDIPCVVYTVSDIK